MEGGGGEPDSNVMRLGAVSMKKTATSGRI